MSVSDMKAHAAACHQDAVRLEGVLMALATLHREDLCPEGVAALTDVAEDLSRALCSSLDSVSWPGEAGA